MSVLSLGEVVRRKRMEYRWTQSKLGELTGYSRSSIFKIENNKMGISKKQLKRLEETLKVDLSQYIEIENYKRDIEYYIRDTIKRMKSLGTYRSEFLPEIRIYATVLFDYEETRQDVIREKLAHLDGVDSREKKSAAQLILEKLRADVIKYSDMLLLNAKAFGNQNDNQDQRRSKLDELFS